MSTIDERNEIYLIPEENYNKFVKTMKTLQNKAETLGCEINFDLLDCIYQKIDGDNRKFYKVNAWGLVKVEGWEFVGTIQHTPYGNILRSMNPNRPVPEDYRYSEPYCDHCNTRRHRKDTYVVYNETTGEYRQLGKSCLQEYIKGLSASHVALLNSFNEGLINACFIGESGYKTYLNVKELLRYYLACVKAFGYAKVDEGNYATKNLGLMLYRKDFGSLADWEKKFIEEVLKNSKFDVSATTLEESEKCLEWARNNEEYHSNYMMNLKIVAKMNYCGEKDLGLLAAMASTYLKSCSKHQLQANNSRHLGSIGERITIDVADWKVLSSWENGFGICYLYEFITPDGDVVIWKTGKFFDTCNQLSGTVKDRGEFNGTLQTVLTRCKILK